MSGSKMRHGDVSAQGRLSTWPWLSVSVVLLCLVAAPPAERTARADAIVTPTPRYAPTATSLTQAGHGADLFYLHCMPCHGDRGQGLTEEFRNREYPPDDANCWKSGCHGERPYDNGFTLPKAIPAVIGPGALGRFATAAELYDFVRRAMPFNAPGSLGQGEYLQLTAFLLERNGVAQAGVRLDPAALPSLSLRPSPPASLAPAALTGVAVLAVTGIVLRLIARFVARDCPN